MFLTAILIHWLVGDVRHCVQPVTICAFRFLGQTDLLEP
jgi:hypothetical protein